MKSNIGFLQLLVLLFVLLNALNIMPMNSILLVGLIIVAWIDSYIKTDIGGD